MRSGCPARSSLFAISSPPHLVRQCSNQKCANYFFFFRPSAGFSASFGISHIRLNLAIPGMRFSSHNFCTRRSEIPHFFAASGAEIYSSIVVSSCKSIRYLLYTVSRMITRKRMRIIQANYMNKQDIFCGKEEL